MKVLTRPVDELVMIKTDRGSDLKLTFKIEPELYCQYANNVGAGGSTVVLK